MQSHTCGTRSRPWGASNDARRFLYAGTLLSSPTGVAVAGSGTVYIANLNGAALKLDVSDPPSLLFGSPVGLGSGLLTIMNLGNATMFVTPAFPSNQDFSFITSPSPYCSKTGQVVSAGAECLLKMLLNTTADVNDSIVLTDNSLNAAATQTITLHANLGAAQASQTITFPNPGPVTYGTYPISLLASATSGLPVSYAVTSGPATVNGSTLTITGAGTVTVQATQAGNSSYSAATPTSVSITVTPASLTVAANSTSVALGAPIPTLTGTLTGVLAGDGITAGYTTTAIQGSPAGTYPITATLKDPNSKLSSYNVTNTPGILDNSSSGYHDAIARKPGPGCKLDPQPATPRNCPSRFRRLLRWAASRSCYRGAPNLDFYGSGWWQLRQRKYKHNLHGECPVPAVSGGYTVGRAGAYRPEW